MKQDIIECGFDKEKLNAILVKFNDEKKKQSEIRQDLYHYSEEFEPHSIEFTILNLKISIYLLERNLVKSGIGITEAVIRNKRGDKDSKNIVGGVGYSLKKAKWKTRRLSRDEALHVPVN